RSIQGLIRRNEDFFRTVVTFALRSRIHCLDRSQSCPAIPEIAPMSASLRFNDALLIADRAFRPLQCIAWAPQDGNGELNISLVDRSRSLLGRTRLPSSTYSDPLRLEEELQRSRQELIERGVVLEPWRMPA